MRSICFTAVCLFIIVIARGAKVKVEIVMGRISNCHCEEEHGSDVAISTYIKGIMLCVSVKSERLLCEDYFFCDLDAVDGG